MKSKCFHILTLALAFTLAAATSAYSQAPKVEAKTDTQTPTVKTIKLKVGGITCSGDIKDIQKAVEKLEGVTQCNQVGKLSPTSAFEVSFNPAVISEKEIRKVVEDTPGCENPNDRPYKVKQG